MSETIVVRADLEDISTTIKHLHILADYFAKKNHEVWPRLWKDSNCQVRLHEIAETLGRKEIVDAFERLYMQGRDTAVTLQDVLPGLNHIEVYPSLVKYVEVIRGYQQWVEEDQRIIDECRNLLPVLQKAGAVDTWSLNAMIELHMQQLKILRELDGDLAAIEKSERFQIETGAITRTTTIVNPKKVFIIHGRNEAKWRELSDILKEFDLEPVVLQEMPNCGILTLIEKFERYAPTCSFAFAIFMPEDFVKGEVEDYFQARPNVLFELGWFCSRLGRSKTVVLLQNGTALPSDLHGVMQKRFTVDIKEVYLEIRSELAAAGLIANPESQMGQHR